MAAGIIHWRKIPCGILPGTRADPVSTPPKGAASGGEKLGIDSGDL
jgi:hypothetical protein